MPTQAGARALCHAHAAQSARLGAGSATRQRWCRSPTVRLDMVEDASYAYLAEDAPPPLAELAPELTVYVSGLSKSVATGLRIGYVVAPDALVPAIERVIMATTWQTPGVTAAIACRWLEDGTVDRLEVQKRADARERQTSRWLRWARCRRSDIRRRTCGGCRCQRIPGRTGSLPRWPVDGSQFPRPRRSPRLPPYRRRCGSRSVRSRCRSWRTPYGLCGRKWSWNGTAESFLRLHPSGSPAAPKCWV